MSSPVASEAEEDKSVTSAKQGKVRQKLQPGRNQIRGKTLLNIDLFSRDYWTKQPEA
jgi:hypothetical protein